MEIINIFQPGEGADAQGWREKERERESVDAYVCVEVDTSPHEAREALTLAAIISVQALTPDQGCMVLQKAERVRGHKGGRHGGWGTEGVRPSSLCGTTVPRPASASAVAHSGVSNVSNGE